MYCREFERMDWLEVGVLRLANVYGPGDRDRVVPLWLESARLGQDLRLYGGDQILDLVSIETVVTALCRAASRSLHGQPVNVGSGRGVPLRQLAAHIRSLAGPQVRVHVLPSRTPEVTRFTADVCRMREVLGVEPCCDLVADLQSLWGVTRSGAA
jgi:UDP-glucose 4-epimerase